jgi:hypothetical protein
VILLVQANAVRKVAAGGVIAEKISYVVLATVRLAASAVAQRSRNSVVAITPDQVQFASQVLVIIAMGLLAAYFAGVSRALNGFMDSANAMRTQQTETDAEEDVAGG